jgi:hypothetical protein
MANMSNLAHGDLGPHYSDPRRVSQPNTDSEIAAARRYLIRNGGDDLIDMLFGDVTQGNTDTEGRIRRVKSA